MKEEEEEVIFKKGERVKVDLGFSGRPEAIINWIDYEKDKNTGISLLPPVYRRGEMAVVPIKDLIKLVRKTPEDIQVSGEGIDSLLKAYRELKGRLSSPLARKIRKRLRDKGYKLSERGGKNGE